MFDQSINSSLKAQSMRSVHINSLLIQNMIESDHRKWKTMRNESTSRNSRPVRDGMRPASTIINIRVGSLEATNCCIFWSFFAKFCLSKMTAELVENDSMFFPTRGCPRNSQEIQTLYP